MSSTGDGCSRAGPTAADGETRSLHTGSARIRWPSISRRALECPYQVTASSAACTGASGGASGTASRGTPEDRRVSMSLTRLPPASGSTVLLGSELWKRPFRYRGEPAAYGRMSAGVAPIEPGTPRAARATHSKPAPARADEAV